VVVVEAVLAAAGGRIKPRGVRDGEGKDGNVFERKMFVDVFRGINWVDFSGGVNIREINEAGTPGRETPDLGVVIVLSS